MDWPGSSNKDVIIPHRVSTLDSAVKPRDDEKGCGMMKGLGMTKGLRDDEKEMPLRLF